MPLSIPKNEKYTYGNYLNWPLDERWELIEGIPYNMAAAPSTQHQRISWELTRQISNFLRGKECQGFSAPFDVCMPEGNEAEKDISTVVQPDIVVVCDTAKLVDRGCRGAPDFIIEITSPSTAQKDNIDKVALYEKHGVKEYWIIQPTDALVTIRLLEKDKKYGNPLIYKGKGNREVVTLPGLTIDFDMLFS